MFKFVLTFSQNPGEEGKMDDLFSIKSVFHSMIL